MAVASSSAHPLSICTEDIAVQTTCADQPELWLEGSPVLAHDAAYRELLAHLSLASHPKPQSALLIGGSDGLVLQELLKVPQVQRVTVLDTSPLISCLARRYLTGSLAALNDPRVDLRIISADQLQNFIDFSPPEYDIVVLDRIVKPIDWSRDLLDGLRRMLRKGGALVAPVKSPWRNLSLVKELYGQALQLFGNVSFGAGSLLEQEGTIGFLVACTDPKRNLRAARRTVRGTLYWSPAIQTACFCLPRFASDALLQVEEEVVARQQQQRPDTELSDPATAFNNPFILPERFRLSPDKLWIASSNVNMTLKVSPTRHLFADVAA